MTDIMKLMDKETLNEVTTTANGATTYASTGEYLLDLNYNIPSLRNNPYKFENTFIKAYSEDKNLAIRWLLYLRDIKNGAGERNSFRVLFVDFAMKYPKVALEIIEKCNIQNDFGRWDDLIYIWFALKDTSEEITDCIKYIIAKQLNEDIKKCAKATSLDEDCHISLLGKWMPSINTSSKKTKFIANWIANEFKLSSKQYRKMLSILRKHSKVVEVDTSANNWKEIEYERVPSYANLKYKDAFLRHDTDRRKDYLNKLKEGKTTINAGTLFMYDIIHNYRKDCDVYHGFNVTKDDSLEQLWKNLPTPAKLSNTLVVRDGSYSMIDRISGKSSLTSMDIGDSICIFLSQFNTGEFKNKFITFSSKPKIVDLTTSTDNLCAKINILGKYDDCSNTNIEKVFNLILNTAIKNQIKQEDMPERIVIVSDMQFDCACTSTPDQTLFESFIEKYKEHGYKMPKLIFWNTSIYADQNVPLRTNENGVTLLSGFSSSMVNMVVNDELDPFKALIKTLKNKKYDCVDSIEF